MNTWVQLLEMKRRFLAAATYADGDALLRDAASGGPATHYVDHLLQLRARADNRKTLEELRLALDPVGTGPHWLKRFRSAAWLIYITEKELVSSGSAPAPDFVVEVGPSVRDMLVGSGLPRQRKPLRMKLRQRAAKLEAEAIGNGVCVVWMDNYNRQRYSKNPGVRRNQSINGTAIAKLPIKVGANP
jgi:hypothetical protein